MGILPDNAVVELIRQVAGDPVEFYRQAMANRNSYREIQAFLKERGVRISHMTAVNHIKRIRAADAANAER